MSTPPQATPDTEPEAPDNTPDNTPDDTPDDTGPGGDAAAGTGEAAGSQVAVPAEVAEMPADLAQQDSTLAWLQARRTYFAEALPRHVSERHFIQVALACLRGNKSLNNCSPQSLTMALMHCARFGLDPDGVHAAVIAYGNVATFVPMYRGYIDLMHRSGHVLSVTFDWIHEGEEWALNRGALPPDDFTHKPRPDLPADERGPVILAYAFAWMKDRARSQVIMVNRAEAIRVRDAYSKSYSNAERRRREEPKGFRNNPRAGKYNSPWHTDFDAMWAKTAVRWLAKRMPLSPELVDLMKLDDQADSLIVEAVVQEETDEVARARAAAFAEHARDDEDAGEDPGEDPGEERDAPVRVIVQDAEPAGGTDDAEEVVGEVVHGVHEGVHGGVHGGAGAPVHTAHEGVHAGAHAHASQPVHIDACDEATVRGWLLAEADTIAHIIGKPEQQMRAAIERRLRTPLAETPPHRLLGVIRQFREGAADTLRTRGRHTEAAAYGSAGLDLVAPMEVLLGGTAFARALARGGAAEDAEAAPPE